jgi:hypothetical protein
VAVRTFDPDEFELTGENRDPDIPEGTVAVGNQIHMAIVVLAYGIDYDGSINAFHSAPRMADDPVPIIIE